MLSNLPKATAGHAQSPFKSGTQTESTPLTAVVDHLCATHSRQHGSPGRPVVLV